MKHITCVQLFKCEYVLFYYQICKWEFKKIRDTLQYNIV